MTLQKYTRCPLIVAWKYDTIEITQHCTISCESQSLHDSSPCPFCTSYSANQTHGDSVGGTVSRAINHWKSYKIPLFQISNEPSNCSVQLAGLDIGETRTRIQHIHQLASKQTWCNSGTTYYTFLVSYTLLGRAYHATLLRCLLLPSLLWLPFSTVGTCPFPPWLDNGHMLSCKSGGGE